MNRPSSRLPSAVLALTLCLALTVLTPLASAAEGTIDYEHESEQAFEQQLASRQIRSAIINKEVRSVRVTLTDGRHVLGRYPKGQEPATFARLKANGVTVTVLTKTQANKVLKEAPKPHKIRYIAGGVLIVVILIVVAVLVVNRRRRQD
jgi:hypothetical protein